MNSPEKRYAIRAPEQGKDEYWTLIDDFTNCLLAKVHNRVPMARQIIESIALHIVQEQAHVAQLIHGNGNTF